MAVTLVVLEIRGDMVVMVLEEERQLMELVVEEVAFPEEVLEVDMELVVVVDLLYPHQQVPLQFLEEEL